jgi:Bacterial toxin 34
MTSEGNVADTGILQEIHQLMREGLVEDKCEALKIILEDAKRRSDTTKQVRIYRTQKACGCKHSRHSSGRKKR